MAVSISFLRSFDAGNMLLYDGKVNKPRKAGREESPSGRDHPEVKDSTSRPAAHKLFILRELQVGH
jgi:hypothetical protein